jgi:hypothetical protein
MNIKVDNYLPIQFTVLGVGLCIFGVLYLFSNLFVGLGSVLVGVVFSTTHYRLEVSRNKKFYHEYVWFLGLKVGPKIKFSSIEYWYITKSKQTQEYGPQYTRWSSTSTRYNGYLKFSEKEKIYIGDSRGKDLLLKKIKALNRDFGLEVMDYA